MSPRRYGYPYHERNFSQRIWKLDKGNNSLSTQLAVKQSKTVKTQSTITSKTWLNIEQSHRIKFYQIRERMTDHSDLSDLTDFQKNTNKLNQKLESYYWLITAWKLSEYGVFKNTVKHGPKNPPDLDTFYAVHITFTKTTQLHIKQTTVLRW